MLKSKTVKICLSIAAVFVLGLIIILIFYRKSEESSGLEGFPSDNNKKIIIEKDYLNTFQTCLSLLFYLPEIRESIQILSKTDDFIKTDFKPAISSKNRITFNDVMIRRIYCSSGISINENFSPNFNMIFFGIIEKFKLGKNYLPGKKKYQNFFEMKIMMDVHDVITNLEYVLTEEESVKAKMIEFSKEKLYINIDNHLEWQQKIGNNTPNLATITCHSFSLYIFTDLFVKNEPDLFKNMEDTKGFSFETTLEGTKYNFFGLISLGNSKQSKNLFIIHDGFIYLITYNKYKKSTFIEFKKIVSDQSNFNTLLFKKAE